MKNIVKILREKNHLSQEELAKKIGISRQALSRIENDKSQPKGKVILKIAKTFSIPVEKIFFEE